MEGGVGSDRAWVAEAEAGGGGDVVEVILHELFRAVHLGVSERGGGIVSGAMTDTFRQ